MASESNATPRKYKVVEPKSYSAVPLPGKQAQGGEILESATERFARRAAREEVTMPEAGKPPRKRRAVWIVHGMGQQVPFETLDGLAEGIMRVGHAPPGTGGFEPRVRTVQIGDQTVQRVELDVFENDGNVELHLYEAYWAPVTEGQVKLGEVVSFLLSATFRGLLTVFQPFRRAMFNQFVEKKIPLRAALEIGVALATLLSLIAINAVIVAAGASHYGLAGMSLPEIADNWTALSALASCLSAVVIAFGLVIFVAELSHPGATPQKLVKAAAGMVKTPRGRNAIEKWSRRIITLVGWTAFYATLVAIVAGGAALVIFAIYSGSEVSPQDPLFPQLQAFATGLVLATALVGLTVLIIKGIAQAGGRQAWPAIPYAPFFLISSAIFLTACVGPVLIGFGWVDLASVFATLPRWLSQPFWVWPLLLAVSWMVRGLMVEYVGDVAAYVSAQKLDRFNTIRQRIKQIALDSARAVYLAQEGEEFLYEKIAVVGHSLGSVIAYDTLNGLLNAEKLSLTDLKIAERTCLLETFGSPLDKIAFFFSYQGKDTFHIREKLAEVVQPLISSYEEFRRFPWINIYSPNDIISGKVEMYDLPLEGQPGRIQELIRERAVQRFSDPDTIVPLAAHVNYWKNTIVWQKLYEEVTR
jgi:hypothetical protein